MDRKILEKSLLKSWKWFTCSGVMLPSDGSWGVAERVMLTSGNEAKEKTLKSFPAWTEHKDHCIIEQRRADCNMETAFLFLLMHKLFGNYKPFRKTALNILDFLYFKSGLLHRTGEGNFPGTWEWSHIKFSHNIYFDDNAWMVILPLKIAKKYPSLDQKYNMTEFALRLARTLVEEAPFYLQEKEIPEKKFAFLGNIKLPHWGSLVCMALSEAFQSDPDSICLDFISMYEKYLLENADSFTTSEFAYAVLGATASYYASGSLQSLKCAELFAEKILSVMDPEHGSIPSEHYEAPSGKRLADTIYTMNWSLLALQNMAYMKERYHEAYEKILALLLRIQDTASAKHLNGCWRGMYDLENNCWGGGDRFEGGANSIYTGWTNAPIAWAIAFDLQKSNLMIS